MFLWNLEFGAFLSFFFAQLVQRCECCFTLRRFFAFAAAAREFHAGVCHSAFEDAVVIGARRGNDIVFDVIQRL